MLKVLLISHYFSTHSGGVEIVAGRVAAEVAEHHGMQVTWLASDCDPAPDSLGQGVYVLPIPAMNWFERHWGVPFPLWGIVGLRAIWRESKGADCVHLHDALYMGNVLGFLIAKLRRLPVVVTQHIGFVSYDNVVLRALLSTLNHTVARIVLSSADQVVFISAAVEDYFSLFCRFSRGPRYIPNGVDAARFAFLDASSRRKQRGKLGYAEGQFIYLFVGRFVEKKGLSIIRALAEAFPDDVWIIAGHGQIDPESWALHNVQVVRNATGSGLVTLYQTADLLVLPSRGEGFPLVIQEAMACGTPALVGAESEAGCPSAKELLLAENVGSPDTVRRWIRRIEHLKANPTILEALRPKVAAFARQEWSWQSAGKAYAEIFKTCSSDRVSQRIS